MESKGFNVKAAVSLVLVAGIAWNVIDAQTALVDFKTVDDQSQWSNEAALSSSVDFANGTLKLSDSATTGSYESVNYNLSGSNLTEVVAQANGFKENNSANLSVKYKDSGGTVQDTETVELNSVSNSIDLNESYSQVSLEFELDRETTADSSVKVDYFKVKQEKSSSFTLDILKLIIPLAILGFIKFL